MAFFKKLKDNFKISDVDYSVYIDCDDYVRFIAIYNGVVDILANVLNEICNNFDSMIYSRQKIDITQMAFIPDTTDDVDTDNRFKKEYNNLKNLYIIT